MRVSVDKKLYSIDKKPDSVVEAGHYADKYATIRKSLHARENRNKFTKTNDKNLVIM